MKTFSIFSRVSVSEVPALINDCPSKSSLRDPVPIFLLKEFADVLVHPITSIINMSLSSGIFPSEIKLVFVTTLLMKSNLDPNKLCNYLQVSNLSFLSKLVKRVCVKQLMRHLNSSDLLVTVQSSYHPNHSTEMALLRVVNEICSRLSMEGMLRSLRYSTKVQRSIRLTILFFSIGYQLGLVFMILLLTGLLRTSPINHNLSMYLVSHLPRFL